MSKNIVTRQNTNLLKKEIRTSLIDMHVGKLRDIRYQGSRAFESHAVVQGGNQLDEQAHLFMSGTNHKKFVEFNEGSSVASFKLSIDTRHNE